MKNRIKIALVGLLLSVVAVSATAQNKTSYFMESSTYRYDMNPALTPTRGYIKLPGFSMFSLDFTNDLLAIDRLLYNKNGQTVTALHKDVSTEEFLSKFKKNNSIGVDFNLPLLGFADYGKHYFWSFDLGVRALVNVNVPKDVLRLVKSLGSDVTMDNIRLDVNAYTQASLGFAFPLGDYVMFGFKVKGLLGLAHATANIDNLRLNFGEDAVTATGHAKADISVPGLSFPGLGKPGDQVKVDLGIGTRSEDEESEGPEGDDEVLDLNHLISTSYDNIPALVKQVRNGGVALDLGVEANLLDDHLHLSAAVVDLGYIWWNKNSAVSVETNEVYGRWEGANLSEALSNDDFDVVQEVHHNLNELAVTNRSGGSIVTRLPTQLNVGAEYGFAKNKISVGLLSHTKFYESHTYSELTASLNLRAGKAFSASFSYSFLNSGLSMLGFALNLHPKGFNLFIGTDYIPLKYARIPLDPSMTEDLPFKLSSLSMPANNMCLSFYAGISFSLHESHFGKTNKEVRVERKAARKAAKADK
ncbi:MAG: hypothetical protein IJ014_01775 [Rikenellaceae bacterium]|nr:hypothetical protein [Rikenellaceae bacterium]